MKSVIIFALCLAVTQGYSVRGRVPKLTAVQAGGRIINGEYAVNGQFPHMVRTSPGCGGGLISDKWVLSAAHCYHRLPIVAYLGDVHWPLSPVIVNVVRYYNHPLWDDRDFGYDISILELEKSLTFTGNIQPIRIPSSRDELFEGELAVISGFGRTENGTWSTALKYVYQTVITYDRCTAWFIQSTENLICTMQTTAVQAPCSGDSGGPLIVRRPEGDVFIGIVSLGPCVGSSPTGYVMPHFFLEWIRDTTGLDV